LTKIKIDTPIHTLCKNGRHKGKKKSMATDVVVVVVVGRLIFQSFNLRITSDITNYFTILLSYSSLSRFF